MKGKSSIRKLLALLLAAMLTVGEFGAAGTYVYAADEDIFMSEEAGTELTDEPEEELITEPAAEIDDNAAVEAPAEVSADGAEDPIEETGDDEDITPDGDLSGTVVSDMVKFKQLMTQDGDVNIRLNNDLYDEVPYYSAEYDSFLGSVDPYYKEHWDDKNTPPTPYWLTVGKGTKRVDLNGHKLTADYSNWRESSTMFKIDPGTTFILDDSQDKGEVFYDGSTPHMYTYLGGHGFDHLFEAADTFPLVVNEQRDIFEVNGGDLIINSGKVVAGRASSEYYNDDFGTSWTYVDVYKIVNGTAIELNSGNVTINGGGIFGYGYRHVNWLVEPEWPESWRNPDGSWKYTEEEATRIFIEEGKIKAEWNKFFDRNAVIEAYSGKITVNEGCFYAKGSSDVFQIDDPFYDTNPNKTELKILAGEFDLDHFYYDTQYVHFGGDYLGDFECGYGVEPNTPSNGELGFNWDNLVCGKDGVTVKQNTEFHSKMKTITPENETDTIDQMVKKNVHNESTWADRWIWVDIIPKSGTKPEIEFVNRPTDDVRNPKKTGELLVQTQVEPVFATAAKATGKEDKVIYTYEVWDFDGNKLGTCGTALSDSKIDLATAISGLSSKLKEGETYIITTEVREKYEHRSTYEITSSNAKLFAVSYDDPITITKQPVKQLIASSKGQKVKLTAQAENAISSHWVRTSPSYESYEKFSMVEGDGENTLYIIPRGTSKYACVFTNSRGSVMSNEVETCYVPSFEHKEGQKKNIDLYEGMTAYISAPCDAADCDHCYGYRWFKDNKEISSGGKYRIWQDSEGTYLEISNVTAADAGTYMAGIDCDHGVGGGINSGKFVAYVQKGSWEKTISSVKLYGLNDLYLHDEPPKKDSIYCDDPRVKVKDLKWEKLETNKLIKADSKFVLTLEVDSETSGFEFDDLVDWTLNDDPYLSFQGFASDDHKQVEIAWTFGGNTPIKEKKDTIAFHGGTFDIMQGTEDVFVLTDYEFTCPDTHWSSHTVINVEADPDHPMPQGLTIDPLGNVIEGTASAPVGEYDVVLKFYVGRSNTYITDVIDIPITINIIGKPEIKSFSLLKKDLPKPHTEHEFGDYKSDGPDTHSHSCTCEGCDYVETESHNWDDGTVIKEASTTQEGSIQYTCNTCGETKTEVIPKEKEEVVPEHEHKLNPVAAKEATCLETGNKEFYICYGCLKAYSDAAGKNEITDKSTLIIPALGHDWDKWETVTPATETTAGKEKRVCKHDPSHTEERVIPSGDHVHKFIKVARKDPTETEEGNITYYKCEDCGRLYLDAAGTKDTTESAVILPAGRTEKGTMLVYFGDSDGLYYNPETKHYEMTYTGNKLTPSVIVESTGKVLTEDVDYTVKYSGNVNAGTKPASVTVKGKGEYSGSSTIDFYIVPIRIDNGYNSPAKGFNLSGMIAEENKKFAPVISYKGIILSAKDIEVTGSKAGLKFTASDMSPSVTITGKGNFTGSIENIPVIVKNKNDIKKLAVKASVAKGTDKVYDGTAKTLTVTVKDTEGKVTAGELTVTDADGNVLTEGIDFAVSYGDNVNAGKVGFIVTGCGSYTGSVKGSFTIQPDKSEATIVTAVLTDPDTSVEYVKTGATPPVTVTAKRGDVTDTLKEGVDYKIKYSNNKKAGSTGKFTVSFMGNYKGRKALEAGTFTVSRAHLKDAQVYVPDMTYKKEGKYEPAPYVVLNGDLLKKSDYTVAYFDGENDITGKKITLDGDSKEITVKVTGKGNYAEETASGKFTIYKKAAGVIDLSGAKITGANSKSGIPVQYYTGSPIKPAIDVYAKTSAKGMSKIAGYNVTYIANVNKGKAIVMITGDGVNTVGSKTVTFTIKARDMKGFKAR